MARKEPAKGIHTSPDKAGVENVEGKLPKDEDSIMAKLMPVYDKGEANNKAYKGLWTEESLAHEINEFFKYCFENEFKPTKAGLCLWLYVDKSTYWEWETKQEKYGYKSNLLKRANLVMENYLMGNIDKYPTGNIFLLKTSHGHIEASKLDITTNGQSVNSADDVKDLVSKLGLDKQK